MKSFVVSLLLVLSVSGCAVTDIQPLSQSSFKVATTAAPACGASGARKVANQAAAIEVIRRGGDRFIFVGDQSGSHMTGMSYNYYGNGFGSMQAYQAADQALVVQMVARGDAGYSDALSARQLLGPDWQTIYAKGVPDTCTD